MPAASPDILLPQDAQLKISPEAARLATLSIRRARARRTRGGRSGVLKPIVMEKYDATSRRHVTLNSAQSLEWIFRLGSPMSKDTPALSIDRHSCFLGGRGRKKI